MSPEKIEAIRKAIEAKEQALVNTLDLDMVADIENWRCEKGYSWRMIALEFTKRNPEYSFNHSLKPNNQMDGMLLCQAAQELRKQNDDPRWN